MKKNQNVVCIGNKWTKMSKLEWQACFVVGKRFSGSSLTRNDRINCLRSIGRSMQRFGLNNITDISLNSVKRYFAELRDKGLSPGRMSNHATAMRTLCRMMGKSDVVPNNRELGCNRDMANRTKHADERMDAAKAAEVRTRLSETCQIAYDMARHFGLRQKESLLSHRTVNRDGIDYLIIEGAKGGRPRQVPITTLAQSVVIEHNREYRVSHGGKLIDEALSLKQGLKRLQNELGEAGASRTSGANMHTLRREYIIERCQEILLAPIADRENLLNELVESIGHGRTEVIRAYTHLLDDEN